MTSDEIGEVLVYSATYVCSFDAWGDSFQLTVSESFTGLCTFNFSGTDLRCYVYNAVATDKSCVLTLVSESQYKFMCMCSVPYCGTCTTKEFISNSGFSTSSESDETISQDWCFPSVNSFKFLSIISDYAFGKSGGAMYTTINIDGNICLYDLFKRLNTSSTTELEIVKDLSIIKDSTILSVDRDYCTMHFYDNEFTEEVTSVGEGVFNDISHIPTFTDLASSLEVIKVTNKLSRRKLRECTVSFSSLNSYELGQCLTINDYKGVVYSLVRKIPSEYETDVTLNTYKLVCPSI